MSGNNVFFLPFFYDPKDWQWRIPSSVITFVPRYIFSVLANGTDIGADTTGPVVFITDLYMVFCAGNFIHLVNAVLAFCETMGRQAFQAFSAVDAEIFFLHGICRDRCIGEDGYDAESGPEFA